MTTAGPRGVFVVGTDTEVGKTWVAAAIARAWMSAGHRVGVLKPASTGGYEHDGSLRSSDADALIAAISTAESPFPPPPHERVAPLIYPLPLAPVAAARAAGQPLEPPALLAAVRAAIDWWVTEAHAELLVVEGVGGLLCPLAEAGWTVADLAVWLDLPVIIVARRGLGTLNQTLLTAEAATRRGLRVAGIVLNGTQPPADAQVEATNPSVLASHLPDIPILAEWPFQPANQASAHPEAADWIPLAQPPRVPFDADPVRLAPGIRSASAIDLTSPSASDEELPALSDPPRSVLESSSGELPRPPASVDAFRPLPGPVAEPIPAFPGLDFDRKTRPGPPAATATTDDDLSDDPTGPAPWKNALLASYASAMTLALIWTLYQGRVTRSIRPSIAPPAAVETHGGAAGKLGDRSRRVPNLPPIAANRQVELGQTIQIESLAIEPLAIARQDLLQERVGLTGKVERRDGGKRAVTLRVRLQNRSNDQIFAPVDPAFVRIRVDDVADTLLELNDGRKVYPGTLAVDSEWAVVGENFDVLRPGESREVVFTTEPNAPTDAERRSGMWRLKLRTGIDSTALVGVRLPDRSGK